MDESSDSTPPQPPAAPHSQAQLYSLCWGEFSQSLVAAVQFLRCHNDLTDVTLAAGGRSFRAHKIVLSAASPFLLELLKVCLFILYSFIYFYIDIYIPSYPGPRQAICVENQILCPTDIFIN